MRSMLAVARRVLMQFKHDPRTMLPSAAVDALAETVQGKVPSAEDFEALMPITDLEVSYLHGSESWTSFDFFGPMFIGIFVFVFVVPQILLSGIFDLSQTPHWMQAIASVFPVYYGVDALRDVMLRGAGFADVVGNLAILWGFVLVFFALASVGLRKKKAKQK